MAKFLLDYVFKILVNTPIAAANTAFLKQLCIVAKPKDGSVEAGIYECVNMAAVQALTDNPDAQQAFNAGMSRVFILISDDLDLADALANASQFFTILVSSDFREKFASAVIENMTFVAAEAGPGGNSESVEFADVMGSTDIASVSVAGGAITVSVNLGFTKKSTALAAILDKPEAMALLGSAILETGHADDLIALGSASLAGGADIVDFSTLEVGTFKGVVGLSGPVSERANLKAEGTKANRSAWLGDIRNMVYAFGKMLSNAASWKNQQYIQLPYAGVTDLGDAESLFDDRINFGVTDDDYGNRLALFVAGGKAIVAPYILKNLCIDLQGSALTWINLNQPDYNLTQASLLEDYLNQRVIEEKYIAQRWVTAANVQIELVEDNFVANGEITVTEPRALWRIAGEMTPS